jgi:hypothetical protein
MIDPMRDWLNPSPRIGLVNDQGDCPSQPSHERHATFAASLRKQNNRATIAA